MYQERVGGEVGTLTGAMQPYPSSKVNQGAGTATVGLQLAPQEQLQ